MTLPFLCGVGDEPVTLLLLIPRTEPAQGSVARDEELKAASSYRLASEIELSSPAPPPTL
jgi:hypothetical protein